MIETGILRRRDAASCCTEVDYEMRFLGNDDLSQIMELQELIIKRLSRKDLLEAFPYEFMEIHLDKKGFVLGIFVQEKLIAFRNVYFPDIDDKEWNLGYDIGLNQPDDLKKVANLQMVCVHPHFRGNSLAMRMNATAIDRVRKINRITHLCATVSPYNYWNIKILLNSEFSIRKLKLKYNGKLRYVVYQNLNQPIHFSDTVNTQGIATARLTDIEQQEKLIKEGLIGIKIKEIPDFRSNERLEFPNGFEVIFSKPPQSLQL